MDYPAGTPMPQTIPSTSDERVVNNVMRHNYRVLSDEEKAQMQAIKDKGLEFIRLLHQIGGTLESFETVPPDCPVLQNGRCLALAQTKMEEAVMWATKQITQ